MTNLPVVSGRGSALRATPILRPLPPGR